MTEKTAAFDVVRSPMSMGSDAAPRFAVLPPLAIYVHIPWCLRKCPYCDFNSFEAQELLPERSYAEALIADLEAALPLIWGRKVATVFFGGGTPSLFSASTIEQIVQAIRARTPLAVDAEVTLEANPGTFEREKFLAFRDAGVNRLSIGVQSFNATHLKALGRVHDADEAHRAIELARTCYDNFNIDLMYGLPHQSVGEARADLSTALAYAPSHLSVYHLTIEPNTVFHHAPPDIPDDDVTASMQESVEEVLSGAGYRHYETSAFSLPGRQCRHNLNYWTFGDYLGIGAGAHSKLSFADGIQRQIRYRRPADYVKRAIRGSAIQQCGMVAVRDVPFEFMMNALRLTNGVPTALFESRAGLPLESVLKLLDEAEGRGLLIRDHERITPTVLGRRFLNDLLQIFLPESEPQARRA